MIRGNAAVRREAHLRWRSDDPPRERFVFIETDAEGATAPETLRQKDRVGGISFWKAGRFFRLHRRGKFRAVIRGEISQVR
jgi:hypothetical protein